MPVKLAKKVGFCFGVRRAVSIAEEVIKEEKRAYSLGSLIHNKEVVRDLSGRGLKVIDDINKVKTGCIVISSHGISPRVARKIKKSGIKIIDTTCPFVLKAQKIAKSLDEKPGAVIIVTHSEMFLHHLSERLIVFNEDRVFVFEGSYQDFLDRVGWEKETKKPKKEKKAKKEEKKRM